jgi:hypothetical protein
MQKILKRKAKGVKFFVFLQAAAPPPRGEAAQLARSEDATLAARRRPRYD